MLAESQKVFFSNVPSWSLPLRLKVWPAAPGSWPPARHWALSSSLRGVPFCHCKELPFVIADLIRNPVAAWHWIPGQARDDNFPIPQSMAARLLLWLTLSVAALWLMLAWPATTCPPGVATSSVV